MTKVSEEHPKLYHYTTFQGAKGILESQTIWGSHCGFLNDKSERILIKDKLIESIYPHILKSLESFVKNNLPALEKINSDIAGGVPILALKETTTLVNIHLQAAGDEFYVTSFCGQSKDNYTNENGLLSQWRGYGKDGGVAIVFNTKKLEDILEKEAKNYSYSHVSLADLIYSDDTDKFEKELLPHIDEINTYSKNVFDRMIGETQNEHKADNAYTGLVQAMMRYKHLGFKEEKEVRIICAPISHTPEYLDMFSKDPHEAGKEKPRLFRDPALKCLPYIELFKDLSNEQLPIEKIIIGPHADKNSRASSLEIIARSRGIKVIVSDIPYAS